MRCPAGEACQHESMDTETGDSAAGGSRGGHIALPLAQHTPGSAAHTLLILLIVIIIIVVVVASGGGTTGGST